MAETPKKDILEYLQCMVNTETPTPPRIVNDMLDLIPESIWLDDNAKILCPACKDGIFLREATLRILRKKYEQMGPVDFRKHQDQIIDHILRHRMFGIAISYRGYRVTKRSLYTCSNKFADIDNIFFDESLGHYVQDKDGRKTEMQSLHFIENIDEVSKFFNEKGIKNMYFDVIVGNPPYQLNDGGAQASAKPLYNLFVTQAKRLQPKYITMIIPSRFFTGGKGLDEFREEMIHDKRIIVLHDFANSQECFNGVDIKGGVCYFKWARDTENKCDIYRHDCNGVEHSHRYLVEPGDDIFIRCNRLISIKNKVQSFGEKSFEKIVSPRKPYGFSGDFFKDPSKYGFPEISKKPIKGGYTILGLNNAKRTVRYLPPDYPIPNTDMLHSYKIFITRNYGCGEIGEVPATPVLATPEELCTETFIQIGPFASKTEMENCYSYIKTKFFRCIVGIRKQDQGATRSVYRFVPMQDFSKPWTDEKLYKKYKLDKDEIEFIESMIKPFNSNTVDSVLDMDTYNE